MVYGPSVRQFTIVTLSIALRRGVRIRGPGGNDIAWYCTNAGPNWWGLFDMIGNAAEWVASVGPTAAGYGDGPFSIPRRLWCNIGAAWNIWPSFHRAGRASTVSPRLPCPSLGLRLVRPVETNAVMDRHSQGRELRGHLES
jgi:hypothetical protein